MSKLDVYKKVLPSVPPIIFRNFFVLVNGIIFVVIILLFVFGNPQAGLFLGIVFLLNTFIGTAQDIHARVLLERLQMLTALHVLRINNDKTETSIPASEIKKGDLIRLVLGDQVPCEGILSDVQNLEISEALVTGESDTFPKKDGDKIIAGAIVTAGSAIMMAEGAYGESRLSVIAGEVKNYIVSPSSIQTSTNTIIKYSSYILVVVLLYVVLRGFILHLPKLEIVTNVGAMASTLVPQGLVVAITLLFAVGAAYYSTKDVLFQEINSTEKLGRIKNICIDKTGTLTDNVLVVEKMHMKEGLDSVQNSILVYACIRVLNNTSQTIFSVKEYLEKFLENENKDNLEKIKIVDRIPFSSWRRYEVVQIEYEGKKESVLMGTPDVFLGRIYNKEEKTWLENTVLENARNGKRVLCVARSSNLLLKDLSNADLNIIAIFVFKNTLRPGIVEAIKFFKNREVNIRVLSGDNALTVKAVAESVGIKGFANVITGDEIKNWTQDDFDKYAHDYTIFAQILPEHKVKLIEAFKKDGFTAMVGDGVNDALAMKQSDIGIAMWDGVPVTRQLADVILMTNSFSDLPGAVELADHFIRSIEISSGIYINQSLLGLFFFIIISIFGYSYPITPLNITFMNYFTVGFSTLLISYWALRPSRKIPHVGDKPFLKRIMPLVFVSSVLEAIGVSIVFFLSPEYLKIAPSNSLVGLSFILFGFMFLIFATEVYCGSVSRKEKIQLVFLGIFELIIFICMLQVPILLRFFNITIPYPSLNDLYKALLVIILFILIQYLVVKEYFKKNI